jgi:hypothetical protein
MMRWGSMPAVQSVSLHRPLRIVFHRKRRKERKGRSGQSRKDQSRKDCSKAKTAPKSTVSATGNAENATWQKQAESAKIQGQAAQKYKDKQRAQKK